MGDRRQSFHPDGGGAPFQGMGGAEEFVHRLPVARIMLQSENILFKNIALLCGFLEKIRQEFPI